MSENTSVKETEKTETKRDYSRTVIPQIYLSESDSESILVVEMPGVDKSAVDVTYENDALEVVGKTNFSVDPKYKLIYSEFQPSHYKRKFTVNRPVDLDKVTAVMRDGQLTLTLPKVQPETKKITVQSN